MGTQYVDSQLHSAFVCLLYVHGAKPLRNHAVDLGLDLDRDLIRLDQHHHITILDGMANFCGPFDNCSLPKAGMHYVSVAISRKKAPKMNSNAKCRRSDLRTSVMESPIEGTFMVFFSKRGTVAVAMLLERRAPTVWSSAVLHRAEDRQTAASANLEAMSSPAPRRANPIIYEVSQSTRNQEKTIERVVRN